MKSYEAAAALAEARRDGFYIKAFMIQGWLEQLVAQAAAEHVARENRRYRVMQTGQAQRGFLQVFGNVTDEDFHDLLESLYRFTEYDHPLAGILFRALVPLSVEQECSGDFLESRAPDLSKRPNEAAVLLRRSLERWCDWIDAVVHLRTHARWHLAPECFNQAGSNASSVWDAEWQQADRATGPGTVVRQRAAVELPDGWSDTAQWEVFSRAKKAEAKAPWPFREVDEAVISMWPLLRRHNWTYGDLLNVLRDLLRRPEAQPCRNEQVLAAYCATGLGLHRIGRGETAKDNRPAGYEVALRLCPPLRPPTAAGEPPWFDPTAGRKRKTDAKARPAA